MSLFSIQIYGTNKPVVWVEEKPTLSQVKNYINYANLMGHNIKVDKGFKIIKFNLPIVNSESISLALSKIEAEYNEAPFIAWREGCCFVE